MWMFRRGTGLKRPEGGSPRRGEKTGRNALAVWKSIAGPLAGAAASLLAFYALRSGRRRKPGVEWAQSGQAPGRNHIRLSAHPAAQGR